MHDIGALILEGIANSVESGADQIELDICKSNDSVRIQIKDNGTLIDGMAFFEEGFSTKGKDRGRGLTLIKRLDCNASLKKQDGYTLLSFEAKDDGSLDKLEDVLFPIFQQEAEINLRYEKDGKEVLGLSGNGKKLQTVKEIAEFKQFVRFKTRSV